jgi:RHS repeat-associated protein
MVQQSTNNIFENVYKFNAKELDESTGYYYYGARYYDPAVSIFLSVDPLAEQFPAWNPYTYTMNNPVNLVDPTGMAPEGITPKYRIEAFSANKTKNLNTLPENVSKAFVDIANNTTVGKEFFSNFLRKDESFAGLTGESNGKYSNIELKVWAIDDSQVHHNYWTAWESEGYFTSEIDGEGNLIFNLGIDPRYNSESIGESILHEISIHGQHVKDIIEKYRESGSDETKKYIQTNSNGRKDHKDLRYQNLENKGYKQYSEGKNELIKKNNKYKKTFETATQKYENNYRNL